MEYLLKVSAVVAIFYVCYKLFLQRDTFFEQNRWFLLLGLLTSFLVPFFVIPNYIEYVPTEMAILNYDNISVTNETEKAFNILDYFPLIYGLGVLCFLIRFLIQLCSLCVVVFNNKRIKNDDYTFVETNKNISPFSFFNWIVYNPNNFNETDLNQIITHEKVHVNQYHSVDILLTQLVNVVLWFNPIIWFYNKDLKQNLEFIADKTAQNKLKCKKSYQTTLLKASIPSHQMVLSNNFYNSLIKKRIVMLHKSKSKKINQIKFVLVIPFLVLFLMSFNTKDIYIEKYVPTIESPVIDDSIKENNSNLLLEKNKSKVSPVEEKLISKPNKTKKVNEKPLSKITQEKIDVLIDKNTTDASLDKTKASLKEKGISTKFKNIKRNSEGYITAIKIDVSSKEANANYNVSSDTPIKPIAIIINGDNISIGNKSKSNDAKEFVVTGRVSNSEGVYLPGTTIIIKNTKKGAITDFDGKYEIKTKEGDVLAYNYVGFDTKAVKVEGDDEIDVILNEQQGKGSENKARISSTKYFDSSKIIIKSDIKKNPIYIINSKVLSKEEIEDLNPEQIESVSVIKGEKAKAKYGDKGENGVVIIKKKKNKVVIDLDDEIIITKEDENPSNIVIRGTSKKDKPLIIIDGKETEDKIEDLDPDDIKSMNVLKGESAIEKYGIKGKHGVIEITTRKN